MKLKFIAKNKLLSPMYRDITELFIFVDDFCKAVDEYDAGNMLADQRTPKPTRTPEMRVSEILVIMILFQQSPRKKAPST